MRIFDPDRDSVEELGPYWLETVQGSLSAERSKSKPQTFKVQIKKARVVNRLFGRVLLKDFVKSPESHYERISDITALYPDVNLDFRIKNFEKIVLGRDQNRKLRALIFFVTFKIKEPWIKMFLWEKIDKLISAEDLTSRRKIELFRLKSFHSCLSEQQFAQLLENIYQGSTIKDFCSYGELFFDRLYLTIANDSLVRIQERQRGYNDKGSTRSISEKERRKSMKEIAAENEILRQRILNKQMKLFEANLGQLLHYQDPSVSKQVKRIQIQSDIKDVDKELIEIHNQGGKE